MIAVALSEAGHLVWLLVLSDLPSELFELLLGLVSELRPGLGSLAPFAT
jgi:hypothetical protein